MSVAIQGLKFSMMAAHYSETSGLIRPSSKLYRVPDAKENPYVDKELKRISNEMLSGTLSFSDGTKQSLERYATLASEQTVMYNKLGDEIRRLRKESEMLHLFRTIPFIIQLVLLCYLIWKGSYPMQSNL